MIERFSLGLFRRHVGDRPEYLTLSGQLLGRHRGELASACRLLRQLGQAEVQDFEVAVSRHHHVAGLQVTMRDAAGVRRGNRVRQLNGDLQEGRHRCALPRQHLVERLPFQQLHGQEG